MDLEMYGENKDSGATPTAEVLVVLNSPKIFPAVCVDLEQMLDKLTEIRDRSPVTDPGTQHGHNTELDHLIRDMTITYRIAIRLLGVKHKTSRSDSVNESRTRSMTDRVYIVDLEGQLHAGDKITIIRQGPAAPKEAVSEGVNAAANRNAPIDEQHQSDSNSHDPSFGSNIASARQHQLPNLRETPHVFCFPWTRYRRNAIGDRTGDNLFWGIARPEKRPEPEVVNVNDVNWTREASSRRDLKPQTAPLAATPEVSRQVTNLPVRPKRDRRSDNDDTMGLVVKRSRRGAQHRTDPGVVRMPFRPKEREEDRDDSVICKERG